MAYTDSNWEPAHEINWKSLTDVFIRFGSDVVYAASKDKKTAALSSADAKCTALRGGVTMVTWFRGVLHELNVQQRATVVTLDNRVPIEWAAGGTAKHFANREHSCIKHNYVMELLNRNKL